MAIESPISDLARSTQHDQDQTWPHEVKISMRWKDARGRLYIRSELISSERFFGTGSYGAPMSGSEIVGMIERFRRAGPPDRYEKPPKIIPKGRMKR